jgi:hypothetical protein
MYGDITTLADSIVGRKIGAIYWSEDLLTFETDQGLVSYYVEGDCCSHSYFFDFYGVDRLIGSRVTAFEAVNLAPGDPGYLKTTWDVEGPDDYYGDIKVYGYRFTTEHPTFGPVSSVLSFRNSSNGYYGGWMDPTEGVVRGDQKPITEDVIG